jgi:CheY-like chemotaxis protein
MNQGLKLLDFICNHPVSDLPFLIVIDQYLPDIDSLELLEKLRNDQQCRLIPIAIMAGFASEELIRDYYLAGANCCYKKPLDLPDWNHMADCLLTLFYNRC